MNKPKRTIRQFHEPKNFTIEEVRNAVSVLKKKIDAHNRRFKKRHGELFDANEWCAHRLDPTSNNGIKCKDCGGWYCE